MGYALDRLMAQYGVGTPTSTGFGTPAENAAYSAAYRNRVANTPQYLQGQYKTKSATASTAPTFSRGSLSAIAAGFDPNKEIQNWFAAHPNASASEIEAIKAQVGASDRDVRNAMGTGFRYGKSDDPSDYAPGYTGPTGSSSTGYGSTGVNAVGSQEAHQQIRAWLAANPNATDEQIRAKQSEVGASNRDVYDATGNFWGNTLKSPDPVGWAGPTDPADPTDPNPYGYTEAQIAEARAWMAGKSPAEVARRAVELGLNAGQIQYAYSLIGQTLPTAELNAWVNANNYYFDSNGALRQGAGRITDVPGGGDGGGGGGGVIGVGSGGGGATGGGGGGAIGGGTGDGQVQTTSRSPTQAASAANSAIPTRTSGVANGQFTGPVSARGMHVDRYGNEQAAEPGNVEGTGYYTGSNAVGSQYPITTNAKGEKGITIKGQFVPSADIKAFYENGGNANELLARYGITNPSDVGGINAAARAAGDVQMTPMENMQAYFKQYQKYNPTGKYANDFEGFITDQNPFTRMNMRTGQYSGAVTALGDFEPGGIYGPGSDVYGRPGYGSGLGPRGIGVNGGDWQNSEQSQTAPQPQPQGLDIRLPTAQDPTQPVEDFSSQGQNTASYGLGRDAADKATDLASLFNAEQRQNDLGFDPYAGDRQDVGGYAHGGSVRTHFQTGGINDLAAKYADVQEPTGEPGPGKRRATPQELALIQADARKQGLDNVVINLSEVASYPGSAPTRPAASEMSEAPVEGRGMDLLAMLAKYQPKESAYAAEYQTARGKADRETQAFQDMLQKAIEGQQDQGPSQSEKYFRLAAAFGAPTRTGHFGETMSNAAGVLGDFNKEQRLAQRAGQAQALQLGLQGQQARMAAAKEDLNSLRSLTGEEMKDKRTITTELIKDYVASGKPQSTAGKQAIDEGLVQGTAPFQKRVAEIANMNVEKQLAQINSTVAGMTVAQANLALAQNKFALQRAQAAKLTPTELKLKTETEDIVSGLDASLSALTQAYKLNPTTFDNSLADIAQRKVLESAGSDDPKVVNTRLQENLLTEKALAGLRAAFGGNPTEGERAILLSVQGIGAKSRKEREEIMKNAYTTLKTKRMQHAKRLAEIKSGAARDTTSIEEGVE